VTGTTSLQSGQWTVVAGMVVRWLGFNCLQHPFGRLIVWSTRPSYDNRIRQYSDTLILQPLFNATSDFRFLDSLDRKATWTIWNAFAAQEQSVTIFHRDQWLSLNHRPDRLGMRSGRSFARSASRISSGSSYYPLVHPCSQLIAALAFKWSQLSDSSRRPTVYKAALSFASIRLRAAP